MLDDLPGEEQVAPGLLADLAADGLHARAILEAPVAVLHQNTAEHALVVLLARVAAAPLVVSQDSGLVLAQGVHGLLRVCRREQDIDELIGEQLAELGRDRSVEDDYATIGGGRVGGERSDESLFGRGADGDPTGVAVLDDHAGRQRELVDDQARGREIVQVVEAELAPV